VCGSVLIVVSGAFLYREWVARKWLSYLELAFNMCSLHVWVEGADGGVCLSLQFGLIVVQIALEFVLGRQIVH